MLTTTERERFATSTAPPAPVREPAAPPAPTRRVRWWVVPLVLLVVFAGIVGAVVAAIVFDGDEVAIVPEWMPEYDVDTPAIFGPPATFWVGEDANLDPDLPRWMQSEYDVDSGLVGPLVVPAAIPFWVGADANLDADLPVWMQSEYDVDSGLVGPLVLPAAIPFWVGADANLDADLPVWMQSEYAVDTPASSYEPLPTIDFWVGQAMGDLAVVRVGADPFTDPLAGTIYDPSLGFEPSALPAALRHLRADYDFAMASLAAG